MSFPSSNLTLRSPPSENNKPSCRLCIQPDTDEMVQCDLCDLWYHYTCVNVSDSISEKDFICPKCKVDGKTALSLNQLDKVSVTSSKRSEKSKKLMLQRLEEERKINQKRELELQHRHQQQDQDYLNRKYQILDDSEDECEPETTIPSESKSSAINNWVSDNLNNSTSRQPSQLFHPIVQTQSSFDNLRIDSTITTQSMSSSGVNSSNINIRMGNPALFVLSSSESQRMDNCLPITSISSAISNSNSINLVSSYTRPIPTYITHQPSQPFQSTENNSSSIPATYSSLSSTVFQNVSSGVHYSWPGNPRHFNNTSSVLPHPYTLNESANNYVAPAFTTVQLAARQVTPKELPVFSGKAEDWPIFISCYEGSTQVCGFSNAENLIRLQRCLKALDAVKCRLLLPHTVPGAIETLRTLYGRPEQIIHSLLQTIRSQPPPKADKLDTLVTFAVSVENFCATLEACGLFGHLTNPSLTQELVDKLPTQVKLNWAIYKQSIPNSTLSTFGSWLMNVARAASEVTLPSVDSSSREIKSDRRSSNSFVHVNTHSSNNIEKTSKYHPTNTSSIKYKCILCKAVNHKIESCEKFKSLSHSEKWNAVRKNNLCRKCLGRHHPRNCESDTTCGQDNCLFKHHRLLHRIANNIVTDTTTSTALPLNVHQKSNSTPLFRIVPVNLYNGCRTISTYAFLDEGSSVTLMNADLADELGLAGTPQILRLKWTDDQCRTEEDSRRVTVEISGINPCARKYRISDVRTVRNLNLPSQSMPPPTIMKKFSHLAGLPIELYKQIHPRMLIGIDNQKLSVPLEVREGSWNQPTATKSRLGWSLHGSIKDVSPSNTVERHNLHICECERDIQLHDLVKNFFSIENVGVAVSSPPIESNDDKRAREIMEATTILRHNRFETGLLWKSDHISLPNSYIMAYNRLICLEKQMQKNPDIRISLNATIADHVSKGYASKLTSKELNVNYPRTWYLPMFSITNPNKPGKRRAVWDAAAKVGSVSLNSVLLKGPDQLVALPEVLYRFRERRVAIVL